MEPDALFHRCVFQWFRKLGQMCGIDLFLNNYKPTVNTYVVINTFYVLLLCCLWTIYYYGLGNNLICVTFLAFDCQGIVKFHGFFNNTTEVKDMCDFCLKVYRANMKSSPNKTCLEKSVKLSVLIFKYGMCLLITTATLLSIKPLIFYHFFAILEPILPIYFPGIDEEVTFGFVALAVFHLYIVFLFVAGTAATDLALMGLVIHCNTMTKLFKNAVDEFNRLVENNRRHARNKDIHASLRNLILMHTDFMKYTKILKLCYNDMCLIQILMSNAIMIVLVYDILMTNDFTAYFLLATAFFQVFEYSVLGTIIEISNDNMYATICNILATELPIKEQKKVILMILIAQHPHNLSIGGFDASASAVKVLKYTMHGCSVASNIFLNVSMKTTYSVGMLLINAQK